METYEESVLAGHRRDAAEYPLWCQDLLGLKVVLGYRGTVWAAIFPQLVLLMALALSANLFHIHWYTFDLGLQGHRVVLVPLSFLLVFRCSNAYQRYWEAKGLLGELLSASRELCTIVAATEAVASYDETGGGGGAGCADDGSEAAARREHAAAVVRYVKALSFVILADVGAYWEKGEGGHASLFHVEESEDEAERTSSRDDTC
eukprot:Rhum_TRINITY_DN12496_c0_g2::Rhum_TRINITY_DN12496_c0_g2_i1::g.52217::m.52217